MVGMMSRRRRLTIVLLSLSLGVSAAGGQTDQQGRCVDTIHRGFTRLAKRQAKEVARCLRQAKKGRLTESLDACVHGDPTSKIARTRSQNIARALEVCTDPALGFGPRSAASANTAAVKLQSAVLAAMFGAAAREDGATMAADKPTAKCRIAVHAKLEKCERATLQAFRRCTRDGIKDGTIVDAAGIARCADRAEEAQRCDDGRIERRMARCRNRGVDLASAFPGCAERDPPLASQCLNRRLECQVCLTLDRVGFVDRDCDVLDDGLDDQSCVGTDRWGGHTGIESLATGRFRVEEIDGLWHFITPDGHGFFSAGVTSVSTGAYSPPIDRNPYRDNIEARYGSLEAWREHTLERLDGWSFNTMGAWSSFASEAGGQLAHTPIVSFHTSAPEIPGWPAGQTGKRIRDFFDPGWPAAAALRAEDARPCAEDPFCLGVFSDNEMPWGPSVFMVGTYLDAYMSLPPNAPGKLEVQAFFQERYADVADFNAAWGLALADFDALQALDSLGSDLVCEGAGRTADRRAFLGRVAERYFSVVHDALRAIDPELLILGPRFTTTSIGPDVIQAAAPYLDVISLNHYLLDPAALNIFAGNGGVLYDYFFIDNRFDDLAEIHRLSGRPMMITEYTTRVPTPDVPVLFPPYFPTYPTQEERAGAYEEYQRQILSRPFMIGTHWFQWEDQPATGRSDGENSHFGVVDIEDDPYEVLTARMTSLNDLTPQRPLPAPQVVFFPDPVGGAIGAAERRTATVPVAPAVEGALGLRTFSIAPVGSDRTGFYIGLLAGTNLGRGVTGGPLLLSAGVPDANGNAALALGQDAVVAMEAITGEILCLRLAAAGSSGMLSCQGGEGHDVIVTRDTGEVTAPEVTQTFLGSDSGPGAATLLVSSELARLPPGSSGFECLSTVAYEAPILRALSTATVTANKGDAAIVLAGENFECGVDGATWSLENGPGMFAIGAPLFDGRVPGGDLAAGLLFADQGDVCP